MSVKVLYHPFMQILHIRNGVHDSTGFHDVRILRIQGGGNNPGFVLPGLEMGVWETEEDFGQLMLLEEVREELHRVGPNASNVLVAAVVQILVSERFDLVLHKLRDLCSKLQTYTAV